MMVVGLTMVVGLLAVPPLAMAQGAPGSQDPLGLITSGAVLPFLGEGLATGGMSFLELYAPVGATPVHMFLFDVNCVRGGPSVNVELTTNDVAIFRIDNIGAPAPTSGLVTAAAADTAGFTLIPWTGTQALAARTLWANSNGNFVRVIDPIALATLDDPVTGTCPTGLGTCGGWNPMRTAAAFFAPREESSLHTTIYFVCPNSNIQRASSASAFPAGGTSAASNAFPRIFPNLQVAGRPTPLRLRIYDDDERLLRDVSSECNCLTIRPVTAIDLVYASAVDAPDGTYTEVEGGSQSAVPAVCSTTVVEPLVTPDTANSGNPCPGAPLGCTFGLGGGCTGQFQQTTPAVPASGPFSFVAYRAITVPGFDVFGRTANGSLCHIRGSAVDTCTVAPPGGIANTGGR
jgi:hypothetical protein